MQAKDVMRTPDISVSEQTRVHDVVRLLLEHRNSAVPVVDADQQVLGLVSEGDLLRVTNTNTPVPSFSGSWT